MVLTLALALEGRPERGQVQAFQLGPGVPALGAGGAALHVRRTLTVLQEHAAHAVPFRGGLMQQGGGFDAAAGQDQAKSWLSHCGGHPSGRTPQSHRPAGVRGFGLDKTDKKWPGWMVRGVFGDYVCHIPLRMDRPPFSELHMSEDGKTMQERLETILRESRLLAQDAGHRVASFTRWAYQDLRRRLGWEHGEGEGLEEAVGTAQAGAKPTAEAGAETTPEGYAVGQVWQPKDASKKARKIVAVEEEGGEYFLIWQGPAGGQQNRIKEASFTRWVRREHARP